MLYLKKREEYKLYDNSLFCTFAGTNNENMRKILFPLFLVFSLAVMAQQGDDGGKRLILHPKDGAQQVFDVKKVQNIQFAVVGDVAVSISVEGSTGTTISATFTPTEDCATYRVACIPASVTVPADELQDYVEANYTMEKSGAGTFEISGLEPETQYTIAVSASDRYGFVCSTATASATTADASVISMPKVGDYYYADGTWSTDLNTQKTAIGIVFCTTTSAADKAKGWNKGYVMALKQASVGAMWGSSQWSEYDAGDTYTTAATSTTDMEGYSKTQHMLAKQTATLTFNAAQAAVDYGNTVAAPDGTSGWFLPSSGQWTEIFVGLGQLDRSDINGTSISSKAADFKERVNTLLSAVGEGKADLFGNGYFWSSSEVGMSTAYYAYVFYNLAFYGYYKDSEFAVRSVLAF